MLIVLAGCATPQRVHSTCVVAEWSDYVALCDDGSSVRFEASLEKGDIVEYAPYFENEEAKPRGYVYKITRTNGTR